MVHRQEGKETGTSKEYQIEERLPMLAAIVKVSGIMSDEDFLKDMEGSFKHKFAKKPEVIEGNMKALELALKEVRKI